MDSDKPKTSDIQPPEGEMIEFKSCAELEQSKPDPWRNLLDREAQLAAELSRTEGKADRQVVQEWWSLVAEICGDFAVDPELLMPAEMLIRVKRIAQNFAYGQSHELVKDALKPGNLPSWQERRDRAIAVAYKRAVDAGLIEDHAPTQTVQLAFGLADTRPVPKWAKDPRHETEFPEVFAYPPRTLLEQFKAAGARYKLHSQTHEAIRSRAET